MDKLAKKEQNLEIFRDITTMELAISDKSLTLASIKRTQSETEVLKFISKCIAKLNDSLNIQRKMNFEQITNTAKHILKDYYYLKQSDLYFVFTQAEKGRYGEFYDCLDVSKIMIWFDKYVEARAEFVFEKGLREHEKTKDSK